MALEIPLVAALYCLTLDYAACGVLGAGRGIPLMLRGIIRHPLNVIDWSRTLPHMKIPQEALFYNELKMS